MTRDGEIPAIFNPKRVRTPSVVVTGDSPNGPYGGFTNILNASNPQITHQDSASSSQQDPNEVITIHTDGRDGEGSIVIGTGIMSHRASAVGNESDTTPTNEHALDPGGGFGGGGGLGGTSNGAGVEDGGVPPVRFKRLRACRDSCCSELAQKMYFGICVTILVTASWVGATHCIKYLYLIRSYTPMSVEESGSYAPSSPAVGDLELITNSNDDLSKTIMEIDTSTEMDDSSSGSINSSKHHAKLFSAPFFVAWFFTNFAFLFFPIYVLGRVSLRKCDKPSEILGDVLRGFRDRGFTIGRFFTRCLSFCVLWLLTTYLYTESLRVLFATDAIALFATNVACVYLLSWVILHEQFVGVRIVAVILCDTGIALLAYMDGITESPTLSGVVYATLAAAGYAVFRVMFRKVMGDPPISQIAFAFTVLGLLNALLCWPICVVLYLSGRETMPAEPLAWTLLLSASILLLVFHILMQFSAAVTYNMFVTLGLITSVPISGAFDVIFYAAQFAGMKLAGVILISVGFFLVMFPENWPDYITRLLRKSGRAILRYQCCCELEEIHYPHSKYHLVGSQCEMGSRSSPRIISRSASIHHRLSHGLHKVPSSLALWPCEMTDLSPTGFLQHHQSHHHHYYHHQQQQQQPQQHSYYSRDQPPHPHLAQYQELHLVQQQQPHSNYSSSSGHHSSSYNSSPRAQHGAGGGGRLFSYFGNDHERERKKSETSFFNLGFRRKSTVVYYAATD